MSSPARSLAASRHLHSGAMPPAKFTLPAFKPSMLLAASSFAKYLNIMCKSLSIQEKSPVLQEQGPKHRYYKSREMRGEGSCRAKPGISRKINNFILRFKLNYGRHGERSGTGREVFNFQPRKSKLQRLRHQSTQ